MVMLADRRLKMSYYLSWLLRLRFKESFPRDIDTCDVDISWQCQTGWFDLNEFEIISFLDEMTDSQLILLPLTNGSDISHASDSERGGGGGGGGLFQYYLKC